MTPSLRNVVLLLAIALPLVACGGGDEEPAALTPIAESSTPPAPTPRGDEAAPPTPVKERPTIADHLRAGSDELPDSYPDDAPVYPGSRTSRVRTVPGNGLSVMFESEDSPKAVHDYMAEFLPEKGWNVITDQPLSSGYVIQGEKGARRINVLTSYVDPDHSGDMTMIAVTVIK